MKPAGKGITTTKSNTGTASSSGKSFVQNVSKCNSFFNLDTDPKHIPKEIKDQFIKKVFHSN